MPINKEKLDLRAKVAKSTDQILKDLKAGGTRD